MKPTMSDAAHAIRTRRIQGIVEDGLTFSRAYEALVAKIQKSDSVGRPCGTYVDDRNQIRPIMTPKHLRTEPEATQRKRCFEHREKVHVFENGDVMKSCTYADCGFGKTRKTHSDRQDHSLDELLYSTVTATEDGEGYVEVPELTVSSQRQVILTAGEDEAEEISQQDYEDSTQDETEVGEDGEGHDAA